MSDFPEQQPIPGYRSGAGTQGESPRRLREFVRDTVAIVMLLAVVVGSAAALTRPWLTPPPASDPLVERYSPISDGTSRLILYLDATGQTTSWVSQNYVIVPGVRAALETRRSIYQALNRMYSETGGASPVNLRSARVIERRGRTIDSVGKISADTTYLVRDARGEFLLGFYQPDTDQDLIFDPPAAASSWSTRAVSSTRSTPFRARPRGEGRSQPSIPSPSPIRSSPVTPCTICARSSS